MKTKKKLRKYNQNCNQLYKNYLIKHSELVNLYNIINKIYNINTIISHNNDKVIDNILENIVSNDIDIVKIKELINKQREMIDTIAILNNKKELVFISDKDKIKTKIVDNNQKIIQCQNDLSRLNKLNQQYQECQNNIELIKHRKGQQTDLEKQIFDLNTKIKVLEKQVIDLNTKNNELLDINKQLEDRINKIKQLNQELVSCKKELAECQNNTQISSKDSNSKDNEIQMMKDKITRLENKILTMNSNKNLLETQVQDLNVSKQKLESVVNRLSGVKEELKNNKQQLLECNKKIEEITKKSNDKNMNYDNEKQKLKMEITSLEKTIGELSSYKEQLSNCKQNMKQLDKNIEQQKKDMINKNSEIEGHKTSIKTLEIKNKQMTDIETTKIQLENTINDLKEENRKLSQHNNEFNKQTKLNQDEKKELQTKLKECHNLREKEDVEKLHKKIEELEGMIKKKNQTTSNSTHDTMIQLSFGSTIPAQDNLIPDDSSKGTKLDLTGFNCDLDEFNEKIVEENYSKLQQKLKLPQNLYYKNIFEGILNYYNTNRTARHHGKQWSKPSFRKAKAIKWFCKYCKVELEKYLLRDVTFMDKVRNTIEKDCKTYNFRNCRIQKHCILNEDNQCMRNNRFLQTINERNNPEAKRIREQLYKNKMDLQRLERL